MDGRENADRVIKRLFKFILTIIVFLVGVFAIAFVMMVGRTYVSRSENRNMGITEASQLLRQTLSENAEKLDADTVKKTMDYLKEKSENGELKTASDVKDAIKEGSNKLGVEIPEETAAQVQNAVETLEDMGFSTEKIIDETQKVYQKYGEEFMDHMEEAFIEASKDAAGNAAQEVWNSVEDTVRQMF